MENLYDLIVEGLQKHERKLGAALKAHRKAGGGPVTPELTKLARRVEAKRREGEDRAANNPKSRKKAQAAQDRADARAHETDATAERRAKQGLPSTPRYPNVGREENARRRRRRGRF